MIFPLFALLLLFGCNNITIYCSGSSEYRPAQPSNPAPSDSSSLDTPPPLPSFPKPAFLMTEVDLKTLDGSARLNDEVLNYYLQLKASESPGVYVFNTFFYPRLKAKGYEHVKKWTKNVDIFAFRIVLFPVYHKELEHWSLVVAEMQSKTLYYFDSIYEDYSVVIKAINSYLSDEHKAKKGNGIEFQPAKFPGEIPKQANDYDCGAFVLKYAMEIIAADSLQSLKFSFGQKNIVDIRKAIKNEIQPSFNPTEQPKSAVQNKTNTNTAISTTTNTVHILDLCDTEDNPMLVKKTLPSFSPLSVRPNDSLKASELSDKNQDRVHMDFGTPSMSSFSGNQKASNNCIELRKRKPDDSIVLSNKKPRSDPDQSNSVPQPTVTPSAFSFVSQRPLPIQTPPPNNSKQPIPVNYNASTVTFSPTFSIPPPVTYISSVPTTFVRTSAFSCPPPVTMKPRGPSSQISIIPCPPSIPVKPDQVSTKPAINSSGIFYPLMGNFSNTFTPRGIPHTAPKPLVQPPQYPSSPASSTSFDRNQTLSNNLTSL